MILFSYISVIKFEASNITLEYDWNLMYQSLMESLRKYP